MALNTNKLVADLETLSIHVPRFASALERVVADLLAKRQGVMKSRALHPLACHPDCLEYSLALLEDQLHHLCSALCNNLCVAADLQDCCQDNNPPLPDVKAPKPS